MVVRLSDVFETNFSPEIGRQEVRIFVADSIECIPSALALYQISLFGFSMIAR